MAKLKKAESKMWHLEKKKFVFMNWREIEENLVSCL